VNKLAWGFIVVLAVVHYDFWYWQDNTLVFGFMPIGLFYQGVISLLAGLGWFMVVKFAWPTAVEEWADLPADSADDEGSVDQGGVRR